MYTVKTREDNEIKVKILLRKNGWVLHKEITGGGYTITHENSGLAIPMNITGRYTTFTIMKYIMKNLPNVSEMNVDQVIKIKEKIKRSIDHSYMACFGL